MKLETLVPQLLDNPADWKTLDKNGIKQPYFVLENYIKYSFAYIVHSQPDKLKYSTNGEWAVFNTRLTSSYTTNVMPVVHALLQELKCRQAAMVLVLKCGVKVGAKS